jgi:Undecaprenyl-phosphate glucose phosphotransferase
MFVCALGIALCAYLDRSPDRTRCAQRYDVSPKPTPMLQEQSRLFQRIFLFVDFALVAAAWTLAYLTRFELFPALAPYLPDVPRLVPPEYLPFSAYLWLLPWAMLASALVFWLSGLYAQERAIRFLRLAYSALKASALALVGIATLAAFYREFYISRLFIGLFSAYLAFFLTGTRLVVYFWMKRQRAKGKYRRRVLIVGAGRVGHHLAKSFRAYPWMGFEVVGFLDDAKTGDDILGTTDQAAQIVDQMEAEGTPIRYVYIALPLSAAKIIERVTNEMSERLAHVSLAPDIFGFTALNARVSDIDGLPVIHLIDEVPLRLTWVGKRLLDIAFSGTVLILGSPLLLAIGLAVKLTSPGPMFYRQERVSLNGRRFGMLKFRSMRTDQAGDVNLLTQANDPRVTAVGRFIRRTSLDELPQFWNVLKGDMSVVGPRPERTWVVEEMRSQIPRYILKHKVPAGITGWAQIHGWRGDTSLEKRIEYDLWYIQHWSLKLDLKIMVMTVWKGLVARNAY